MHKKLGTCIVGTFYAAKGSATFRPNLGSQTIFKHMKSFNSDFSYIQVYKQDPSNAGWVSYYLNKTIYKAWFNSIQQQGKQNIIKILKS